MQIAEVLEKLPVTVMVSNANLALPVTGGYASDLLSNVMGNARQGNIWITMQGHQNIVAVASLTGLSAVIVAGGAKLDNETIRKADVEGVTLLTTELSSFEITGMLYSLGIKGV
ncbi:DRTGG domain-containing protein [Dendrosporobacter sp. 1207_IL3150]|uniref:DRTGG domain-containing protein n=1 Tax=Dendrosporobacter sp. 1207_IL3150 TaxID=3084054 RepID=UPI002FDA82D5